MAVVLILLFRPWNIWQRVIKKDKKIALFTRLLRRYLGSEQYASVGALINIKWLDSN